MTGNRFNPYREWLGLDQKPAHFYELLGLKLWEDDRDRIRAAAARALSTLRRIQPGNRQADWKALLDQLEAARDCLVSSPCRNRYDERLRRRIASDDLHATPATRQPVASARPEADPMAPVDFVRVVTTPPDGSVSAAPTSPINDGPPSATRSQSRETSHAADAALAESVLSDRSSLQPPTTRRRGAIRSSRSLTLIYLYFVVAITFVGLLVVFVAVMRLHILPARAHRAITQARIPQSASDLPLPVEQDGATDAASNETQPVERAATPSPPTNSQAAIVNEPMPESPMSDRDAMVENASVPSTVELDRALAEINELLERAFVATTNRNWPTATELLNQARVLAESTSARARVERFTALNDYVRQYWQAFSDGVDELQGSELVINDTVAFVVEVNGQSIVLRVQGQNKRFARDELPTEYVMAIADRWFDQRAATTHVFRGAFMLVTPDFTHDQVRQEWEQAERAGATLGDLAQILDDLNSVGPTVPP